MKEYKLKFKEYMYAIIVLVVFLLCRIFTNAIIGCVIYGIVVLLLTLILMNDTFKYGINEAKKIIEKVFNKMKT